MHRIAPHHVSWPPSQVPTGAEFVLHCAWDRWNYASPAHVRSLEVWGRRLAMKPTVNQHVAKTNMIKNFIRFYLQHAANVQLFMSCDVQFHPWCWLSFWNVATTFREFYVFFCSRSIEKARAFVLNRPSGIYQRQNNIEVKCFTWNERELAWVFWFWLKCATNII